MSPQLPRCTSEQCCEHRKVTRAQTLKAHGLERVGWEMGSSARLGGTLTSRTSAMYCTCCATSASSWFSLRRRAISLAFSSISLWSCGVDQRGVPASRRTRSPPPPPPRVTDPSAAPAEGPSLAPTTGCFW